MNPSEIRAIFKKSGALLSGHFQLTSGLHSDAYFQCAQVLQWPTYARQLCGMAKDAFGGKEIETVIAPAVGGIVVGYEIASQLKARSLFTERQDGKMRLRRGFDIRPGERILVAEDVTTTGGSVREVIQLALAKGAEVVGVFVIVDRSNGAIDYGVPFISALGMQVQTFIPEVCPLCAERVPIDKPGSRGIAKA